MQIAFRTDASLHIGTGHVMRCLTVADTLREHAIDTVVHLASIVTPGRGSSRAFEYDVDVNGTRNVLQAGAFLRELAASKAVPKSGCFMIRPTGTPKINKATAKSDERSCPSRF